MSGDGGRSMSRGRRSRSTLKISGSDSRNIRSSIMMESSSRSIRCMRRSSNMSRYILRSRRNEEQEYQEKHIGAGVQYAEMETGV